MLNNALSLAKYSKPARCFLQVADATQAQALSQHVPKVTFTDAKGTQNDPVLIGPPQVEYAIYNRVPNYKRRNDVRQGTIDQDPDFIDFLQSLTAPIQKPKALDASDNVNEDNVRVTPLIQHLREKKAAKEKAKNAKQEKQQEDKKAENTRPTSSKDAVAGKDGKVVTPLKTPAKPLGKDIRSPQRGGASPRAQPATVAKPAAGPVNNTNTDRRRPGAVSPSRAAARMLSRDLPFQGARGRAVSRGRAGRSPEVRKATLNNAAAANGNAVPPAPSASPAVSSTASPQTPIATPVQPSATQANSSSPAATTATTTTTPTPINPPTGPKSTTSAPAPRPNIPKDPTAKRAFLKHANASQGINDLNLLTAMRRFGFVTNVTIDNRKGFAYVDFAEPEHLRAAMAASPVPIAQGNVEVLELRNPTRAAVPPPSSYGMPNGAPRGGIGGPRGGIAPGFRGRGAPRGRGRGGVSRGAMANGPVKPIGANQTPQQTSSPAPAAVSPAPVATNANASGDAT